MEVPTSEQAARAEAAGLRLLGWNDTKSTKEMELPDPKPLDISTMCFTSGTTGAPKAAMITHQGVLSVDASLAVEGVDVSNEDVHLSYLPLPHMFDRSSCWAVIAAGGQIGFSCGDVKLL